VTRKTLWTIVALIGSYVVAQAIADVAATKLVVLWGIVLPAGSIIFAATFTIRDLIHKRLGREWAIAAIVCAAVFNIVQALYLSWMAALPSPPFYPFQEEWAAIFGIVPAITIASITAEVVSEWVDTEVYHFWWRRYVGKLPQWTAVVASNVISLPLDSFIFAMLAFVVLPRVFGGEPLPVPAALTLVAGQIVWKAAVTAISTPTIYLVKHKNIEIRGVV
jgi:uncharacterized integral membrane protein (TIGR00697 family)